MQARLTGISSQGRTIAIDSADLLTPAIRETARVEANRLIKQLRLAPYGGETMRERFRYRGDSLWWFTELYLHKMKRLDAAVTAILAFEAACEQHDLARIVIDGADEVMTAAAAAFGQCHPKVRMEVRTGPAHSSGDQWPSFLIGLTATLSRWRPRRRAPHRHVSVAAFVHTAFWRASTTPDSPQHEGYIGPVLDALGRRLPKSDVFLVGVGPRKNFRARRWWDPLAPVRADDPPVVPVEQLAPREALAGALALWRRRGTLAKDVISGDGIRNAAMFRGCDLWPVLRRELEATALLQWPWSARAMDEAGAALDALTPDVAITYAEAGGWGRALVLEARRRGIRSVGVQHGFIYRHWLNYLHEPDEIAPRGDDLGAPIPDRTLLFDRDAARHLESAGAFPPSRLAVTGNARLDELAARVATLRAGDRDALRQSLGVGRDQPLAVLAAKFTEIKAELPALVAAAAALPESRLIIKTHPAETADAYAPTVGRVPNVTIAPADADLARLIVAADGIVTMNSTVAIDGIVLGVPALVVGLPNNLSPFVAAGVMLGADTAAATEHGLRTLLYDREARERLAAAAEHFVDHLGVVPDGKAADRAAHEILALTRNHE